jgi:hypothetical protein
MREDEYEKDSSDQNEANRSIFLRDIGSGCRRRAGGGLDDRISFDYGSVSFIDIRSGRNDIR